MLRVLLLAVLLPQACSAQLIFDFGIGPQAGAFRLSSDESFYIVNSLSQPANILESTSEFYIHVIRGEQFGLAIMATCTLTSPDEGIFYSVTASPAFSYSRYQVFLPFFDQAQSPPDITWEEYEYQQSRHAAHLTLPVTFNAHLGRKTCESK